MSEQPIESLQTPQESDPLPNMMELILNGNGVSLTYGTNEAVKFFTNGTCDPLGKVTNAIAGDWAELQRSAQALDNLARYSDKFSYVVSGGMEKASWTWNGNAADSAGQYFRTVSTTLMSQADTLREIAESVRGFSSAAYNIAGLAAGTVQSIVDNTVTALVILAASVAAKASGVGAAGSLALDAALALQISRVIVFFTQLTGLIGDIFTSLQGCVGILEALKGDVNFDSLDELPEKGYSHPGVSV